METSACPLKNYFFKNAVLLTTQRTKKWCFNQFFSYFFERYYPKLLPAWPIKSFDYASVWIECFSESLSILSKDDQALVKQICEECNERNIEFNFKLKVKFKSDTNLTLTKNTDKNIWTEKI